MSVSAKLESLRTPLRRHRFAFALLLVLAAIPFAAPLLRQEVFTVRDHYDYFQPLRWFTAEELRAGRLPLWNPYSGSGESWLANPQTGVFYPPSWIFLVVPFATAYMLFLLGHMVVLGWGTYLFFERRLSRGAALVGAVALMFSGPMLSLLDISNNLATLAWVPLALWCAARRAWRGGGAALALAFLGGEPFFAAVGALLYVIVALTSGAEAWSLSSRWKPLLLAAAVAFGLSAVQLLPFLEMLRGSDRAAGFEAAEILRDSMPLRDWIRVVIPPSPLSSDLDPSLGQRYIPVVYVGIVTAMLAFVGISSLRRRAETAGWLVLLLLSSAIASGPSMLLGLPVTLFRYPARILILGSMAIAALAAIGWDRIRVEKRWLDLIVVLVIAADLLLRAAPLLTTAPFQRHPVPYDTAIGAETKILRTGSVDPAQRAAWVAGYLNLYDRRFEVWTAAPLAPAEYVRQHRRLLEAPTSDLIDSFGVGWILSERELDVRFQPVARSGSVYAFRVADAQPMAAHRSPGGTVESWSLDSSRAKVVIDAAEPGVVVLRQRSAPGWRAAIDGVPAEPILVDGLFRGVEVPAGRHEITWSYRPLSFLIGAGMTVVTLIALHFLVFVKSSSRRFERENFSS